MKAREVDIDDDDEQEQADIDAMDQDLVDVASETDSVVEADRDFRGQISIRSPYGDDVDIADLAPSAPGAFNFGLSEGVDASRWRQMHQNRLLLGHLDLAAPTHLFPLLDAPLFSRARPAPLC